MKANSNSTYSGANFGRDICGYYTMNLSDFGDPLTSNLEKP